MVGLGLLSLAISPGLAQPADVSASSLTASSGPSLTDVPDRSSLTVRGGFYVPAYTKLLYGRQGRFEVDFTVTLSIHNTSSANPLVVERVAYYDTAGRLVQDYLTAPVAIRPFGTIEVFVPVNDVRGGTGANFVVDWAAAGPIAEPLMEALIIGSLGTHGYSFVGQGRPIRIVGEQ